MARQATPALRRWGLGCGVALAAGVGAGLLVGGGEKAPDPGTPVVHTLAEQPVAVPRPAALRAGTTPTVDASTSKRSGPSTVVPPPPVPPPPQPPGPSTFTIDNGEG